VIGLLGATVQDSRPVSSEFAKRSVDRAKKYAANNSNSIIIRARVEHANVIADAAVSADNREHAAAHASRAASRAAHVAPDWYVEREKQKQDLIELLS
jgi:hypothetical protein